MPTLPRARKLCDEDSNLAPIVQAVQVADRIELLLAEVAERHRRVAVGEWGLRVDDIGGWPLDVGLALSADGALLRAQAEVCGPGQLDPHELLHRNRRLALVRFSETLAGTVWIEGWLPAAAVDAALLDRLLGGLVAAADDARAALRSGCAERGAPEGQPPRAARRERSR